MIKAEGAFIYLSVICLPLSEGHLSVIKAVCALHRLHYNGCAHRCQCCAASCNCCIQDMLTRPSHPLHGGSSRKEKFRFRERLRKRGSVVKLSRYVIKYALAKADRHLADQIDSTLRSGNVSVLASSHLPCLSQRMLPCQMRRA